MSTLPASCPRVPAGIDRQLAQQLSRIASRLDSCQNRLAFESAGNNAGDFKPIAPRVTARSETFRI